MRSHLEIDAEEDRRALLKHAGLPLTPAHAAADGAVDGGDDRVPDDQEEADRGPGIREGVADLPKTFRDAYEPPAEYPRPVMVYPEDFRRGPITAGHDALSPGYEPPLSFPAPSPVGLLIPPGGGECA